MESRVKWDVVSRVPAMAVSCAYPTPICAFLDAPRLRSSNAPLWAARGPFLHAAASIGSRRSGVGFVKLAGPAAVETRRRRRGCARADGAATVTESQGAAGKSSNAGLVDKLLSMVGGTDRGAVLGKEQQEDVSEVVTQLEKYCIPAPLKSPLLFGDWDVAYSSNPTSPGGGYRSFIGRLIFRTRAMIQTITSPDFVLNVVRFALLGFIPGQVILTGKLKALDEKLVRVDFEPPKVQIGPFKIKYGGESSVKISVTYLDERVRLGRGSRGTVFVFTRR